MGEPTSDLVARLRAGQPAALAEYLQQQRAHLLNYIEKNLGPGLRRKVDPEDLFQEVSVDCLRALAAVDFADHDPFGWLCEMAQRRIVDAHRHFFGTQKRDAGREVPLGGGGDTQQAGLIDLLVASITSPSAAFSRDQREFRVQEAVRSLPQKNQAALSLRYVENLPTKEIAARLEMSDAAVRVLLTRTIKKLQELLGTEHTEEP